MIQYTIEINDAEIEAGIARSITLTEGDDVNKILYEAEMDRLKEKAKLGIRLLAEDQVKEAIITATNIKEAEFETKMEVIKLSVKS